MKKRFAGLLAVLMLAGCSGGNSSLTPTAPDPEGIFSGTGTVGGVSVKYFAIVAADGNARFFQYVGTDVLHFTAGVVIDPGASNPIVPDDSGNFGVNITSY